MGQADPARTNQLEMVQQAIEQRRRDVEGRVIVVTGGARGLGGSMAEGFLKAGAKVVAADKTWAGSDQLREQLESSGRGMAVEMDITDDAQLDSAYAAVIQRFGTTDVLVNNAALVSETLFAPLGHVKTLDTKDSDWEAMFKVNVFGTVKVIRRFIQPMLEKKRGSIVNVVSSGVLPVSIGGAWYGLRPGTVEMPYQATKAAVMALTFYLGEEVWGEGVALNAIMPGHTRASWFDATARAYQEKGQVYFMRPVVPEHVLPIMLFLASQDGQGVTGRLYNVTEWNFDHGYGKYAAWHDHSFPPDIEERYRQVEEAMPKYGRSGLSQTPFDAGRVLFGAAMTKLAAEQGRTSG
ncbi:MAG TPA: SDR family oxidoreductase [Chloroflexota bacterium]|nr:SDR family oxidoreductase [Chloroflexota bacterium]